MVMKNIILLFISLCIVGFIMLLEDSSQEFISEPTENSEEFVKISGNRFFLKGKPFNSVAVNYIVSFQTDGKTLWPTPTTDYHNDSIIELLAQKSYAYNLLKADMMLIKSMGFNTIRIVGAGEEDIENRAAGLLSVRSYGKEGHQTFSLQSDKDYATYFNALSRLFQIADSCGLKVVFLLKMRPEIKATEIHFKKLLKHFRNTNALLAIDLFNEPLYFDTLERKKQAVVKIVNRWKKIRDMNAPNILLTIGLEGIREVFEWDPNILNVDFVSLHPYEYEPEQVRNEIYWYGKYIKKPWVIGETSIPADNDSVPYEEQLKFAKKTILQSYHCGAAGYSWWQYKDVNWNKFHPNYMGLLNRKGITQIPGDSLFTFGSIKPTANVFKTISSIIPQKEKCICLNNYYNYSRNNQFRITGKLLDENKRPIKGGVILAWNEWWSHSYHTVTKSDGSFELFSEYKFFHWMASATEYEMIRGDINPDTSKSTGNIPTINLGVLEIKKL